MKRVIIVVVALVFILLFASLFYFKKDQIISPTTTLSPTPMVIEKPDYLLQGGSSYSDPEGVYTFLYPNDYVIGNTDPSQIRVYKQGPTQKGQTEMYDGVIVNFGKVDLNGKSLSEWIDSSINEAATNSMSEVVQAKVPASLNNYMGFSYSLRGLGVSKYVVVQKDINSDYAIVITTLVSDPTNVGFQKEVDDILSTLQILK